MTYFNFKEKCIKKIDLRESQAISKISEIRNFKYKDKLFT